MSSARRRGPPPLARDDAGISCRQATQNKGHRYAADPPTVDEIIAVMRQPRPPGPLRQPPQRSDRRALARRATNQLGATAG